MRPGVTGSITVLLPFYFDLEMDEIIKGEKGNRYLSTGQSDVGGESINYCSHTYSQRVSKPRDSQSAKYTLYRYLSTAQSDVGRREYIRSVFHQLL
jgi:hypothetical protein